MTLGVTYGVTPEGLAHSLNAASDGADALRRSSVVLPSSSFTMDATNAVTSTGGSSYTPELPIAPSNVRDVNAGAMSWDDALRYAPPVGQTPIPLTQALEAASDAPDWSNVLLLVGGAAFVWWLVKRIDKHG